MASDNWADRVFLEGMVFYGFHGVNQAEKELGQRFVVDVAVERDLRPAGESDDLTRTVNYSQIFKVVRAIVEGPSRNLLEAVAERIAARLLDELDVERVQVRIRKPGVAIKGSVLTAAGVEIVRTRRSDE
ncbi:MAG: dihydroneopterin aldolase [Chloroflexi bacterium]|nr:dihydroneopterin aldolase [Chloroflexota bacterium]